MMDESVRMRIIDEMNGNEFERFLEFVFKKEFDVDNMSKMVDQGVDLILDPFYRRIAIQAKIWKKQKVGNKAVQQVNSGKIFHSCNFAWVVTNSYFTNSAKELAKKCDVTLIDRDELNRVISSIKKNCKHHMKK
jgi:HJR/Mrr/RecB family endonuclease